MMGTLFWLSFVLVMLACLLRGLVGLAFWLLNGKHDGVAEFIALSAVFLLVVSVVAFIG